MEEYKSKKSERQILYKKLAEERDRKRKEVELADSEIASLEAELEDCRKVYGIPINPLKLIKQRRLLDLYEQRNRKQLGVGALTRSISTSLISKSGEL